MPKTFVVFFKGPGLKIRIQCLLTLDFPCFATVLVYISVASCHN